MKTMQLLDELDFSAHDAHAEGLFVDKNGRALRFTLKPGQSFRKHNTPESPSYMVVLKGQGIFAGADGKEEQFGPNAMLIFDAGENHIIRAVDQELVLVGFLHGAPGNTSDKIGGEIGRRQMQTMALPMQEGEG
ncbi:MAG TPA: cupin domain-containing protein [Anaerolineae bacterium]|nr:cupin domain-containing protein [Anaerolineae bacterium]